MYDKNVKYIYVSRQKLWKHSGDAKKGETI